MRATEDLYERAAKRVRTLYPDDADARDHCLYDWPSGEDHLHWLVEADEQEIRDWVCTTLVPPEPEPPELRVEPDEIGPRTEEV